MGGLLPQLRPIAAVTMLLEDRKHRQWRVLRHRQRFAVDICRQRRETYDEMVMVLSQILRTVAPVEQGEQPSTTAGDDQVVQTSFRATRPLRSVLSRVLNRYLSRLVEHLDWTKDLSRDYTYRCEHVLHLEAFRVEKMLRLHQLECVALPNIDRRFA